MVTIKIATISDAPVISFLGKQTFTETFGFLFTEDELNQYLEDTFNLKKLESSLLKPHNIFEIMYYDDKPVGYCKVKVGSNYNDSIDKTHVQLQKIYILKEYLGKKLGAVLLKYVFDLSEIKKCELIWLVVLHTNARAIKFYENHGFEKLKKYYYTIGKHNLEYELMVKKLDLNKDFRDRNQVC